MSQHTSLKESAASGKHRNVLKRYERIRKIVESEKWDDRQSIYKLPKLKMIKLKVKKSSGKAEEGKEGEAPGTAVAAPAKDKK